MLKTTPLKISKDQKKQALKTKTTDLIGKINDFQSNVLKKEQDEKVLIQTIVVSEKAKQQLNRDGNVLTKTDLIAILMALNPTHNLTDIDKYNSLTTSDLNNIIRLTVYDLNRSKEQVIPTPQPKLIAAPTTAYSTILSIFSRK